MDVCIICIGMHFEFWFKFHFNYNNSSVLSDWIFQQFIICVPLKPENVKPHLLQEKISFPPSLVMKNLFTLSFFSTCFIVFRFSQLFLWSLISLLWYAMKILQISHLYCLSALLVSHSTTCDSWMCWFKPNLVSKSLWQNSHFLWFAEYFCFVSKRALQVSKSQNKFMRSSFLPKYEQNILRLSAL